MSDRVSSGSERLNDMLGGGLPDNGINLIIGLPGSGKTILAQQYAFHNATRERPAIYLSTVSEPLEKILRFGQTLSFFDRGAIGRSVFYEDLGGTVNDEGLQGVLERISAFLKERRPGMIIIDSFKALHPYARRDEEFRRFLHELAGRLSAFPVTSFWVGEYDQAEIAGAAEFAVADSILSLSVERVGGRELRVFQVLKLRGSDFLSGKHAYRLSGDGVQFFPRLADPVDQAPYELEDVKISSGIKILDEMLGRGYWPGASTLVAGPSGSGKTLMGLHFIFEGARGGEPGVIATLQENAAQLERVANGFGWSLDEEGVGLMYRTPVDLYLDEWVHELLGTVEATGARRIMIDSLGDLQAASTDQIRFREYMYSLLQRCSRQGVSVMMTQEVGDLFGVSRLSEFGISHLSDNVVLLQFLRGESRVKRGITVMKTRASAHDAQIREFEISADGFVVGDHFAADQDLA
ncbi:MAG TPA: ATPase domain-containing protein [Actinomycetota bacterium]